MYTGAFHEQKTIEISTKEIIVLVILAGGKTRLRNAEVATTAQTYPSYCDRTYPTQAPANVTGCRQERYLLVSWP
ncbi:hypothetical protein Misp06_00865 [Microbulbifer sp. NBRC 101763]